MCCLDTHNISFGRETCTQANVKTMFQTGAKIDIWWLGFSEMKCGWFGRASLQNCHNNCLVIVWCFNKIYLISYPETFVSLIVFPFTATGRSNLKNNKVYLQSILKKNCQLLTLYQIVQLVSDICAIVWRFHELYNLYERYLDFRFLISLIFKSRMIFNELNNKNLLM